jgi:hypothetical protein
MTDIVRYLLGLGGIPALLPIIPPALKRKDLRVALLDQFERKTCTRGLVLSGTIQDEGLVLGVLRTPCIEVPVIFPHCALDLFSAQKPVRVGAHIYNHHFRIADLGLEIILLDARRLGSENPG